MEVTILSREEYLGMLATHPHSTRIVEGTNISVAEHYSVGDNPKMIASAMYQTNPYVPGQVQIIYRRIENE